MTAVAIKPPPADEIERVEAWRQALVQAAEEREALLRRHHCFMHGATRTRVIYGPMPWGYGPGCQTCRRRWSQKHGGQPWESDAHALERKRREHAELVAEIEAMSPAPFYVAWEELRTKRHADTKPYHWDAKPDEFGVNHFGSATPDGERYIAMRDRVRRERDAFASANNHQNEEA